MKTKSIALTLLAGAFLALGLTLLPGCAAKIDSAQGTFTQGGTTLTGSATGVSVSK